MDNYALMSNQTLAKIKNNHNKELKIGIVIGPEGRNR